MTGKWFPPNPEWDQETLEEKITQFLNKTATEVCKRVATVADAGMDYDNFPISFERYIPIDTIHQFMKELVDYLPHVKGAQYYKLGLMMPDGHGCFDISDAYIAWGAIRVFMNKIHVFTSPFILYMRRKKEANQ